MRMKNRIKKWHGEDYRTKGHMYWHVKALANNAHQHSNCDPPYQAAKINKGQHQHKLFRILVHLFSKSNNRCISTTQCMLNHQWASGYFKNCIVILGHTLHIWERSENIALLRIFHSTLITKSKMNHVLPSNRQCHNWMWNLIFSLLLIVHTLLQTQQMQFPKFDIRDLANLAYDLGNKCTN